jgi:hypothetical protein
LPDLIFQSLTQLYNGSAPKFGQASQRIYLGDDHLPYQVVGDKIAIGQCQWAISEIFEGEDGRKGFVRFSPCERVESASNVYRMLFILL